MKALNLLFLTLISSSLSAGYIGYETNYSSEIKINNGQSSGELEISLPRVKMDRKTKKIATTHSFLNTSALSHNSIEMLDYVCINERVVLFKSHSQSVYESNANFSNFFASGAVLDALFAKAFRFLPDSLGLPNGEARSQACTQEFLQKAEKFNVHTMKDLRIGEFEIDHKGTKRRPKLMITWD